MVDNTALFCSARTPGLSVPNIINVTGGNMLSGVTNFFANPLVNATAYGVLTDLNVFWISATNRWQVGGAIGVLPTMLSPQATATPGRVYDDVYGFAFTPWANRIVFAGAADSYATAREAYEAARDAFKAAHPNGGVWRVLVGFRDPPIGDGTFSAVAVGVTSISPATIAR